VIIDLFELRCDDCKKLFDAIKNRSEVSPARVRSEAHKLGWVRRSVHLFHDPYTVSDSVNTLRDFCPQCKVSH
jgi:hypothetical protein